MRRELSQVNSQATKGLAGLGCKLGDCGSRVDLRLPAKDLARFRQVGESRLGVAQTPFAIAL